ncbi:MAG: hypothetical protein AB7O50_00465 [Pseudolabrys sp.]
MVAAAPVAATASPQDVETVRRECGNQLRLPAKVCDCMAERAAKMNDNQQAFVAGIVTKDTARSGGLREKMTVAELTQAGMFMSNAPAQCARGQ